MTAQRIVVALAVIACGLAAPLAAQQSYGDSGASIAHGHEAIPVGPFLFSPTLQLTLEYRDNIFFAPPPYEVDDFVYLARLRLLFELPIYESYVRFSYMPEYRDYKDYPYRQNWGHFVDVSTAFEFSSGLKLTAGYKFIRSAMETREVDPGGELMWGERYYDKHFFGIDADYWFTSRDGIGARINATDLGYDEYVVEEGAFYDYNTLSYGIGWLHQLNPTTVLDVSYGHSENNTDSFALDRDSSSDELTLGLRGQLNPLLASEIRFGWRESSYDATGSAPGVEDYSSWIASGSLSYELAHGSSLRLELVRSDYASAFTGNAYYTATGASLIYNLQHGRFSAQARGRYQINEYDVRDWQSGQIREDDIKTFGIGAGYRFTELLSLRGAYLHEKRDTIYRYSYTANMYVLALVVGY